MITQIIFLFILIVLSAFFSSSETAFTSLSMVQIREMGERRGKRGKMVEELAEKPDVLLPTILFGNNLVNIAASAIATQITIQIFGNRAIAITTGVLTLAILIFAEVTPKRIAIVYNDFICIHTAPLIKFFIILFRPITIFIGLFSILLARVLQARNREYVSLEGVMHMVNLAAHVGIIGKNETQMIRNIFRLSEITVQGIMTHRTEVFSLNAKSKIRDVLDKVIKRGFSRIPVFDENPEYIVGVVLIKDILKNISEGEIEVQLKEIMFKPIYVPQTKRVKDMFTQFKREKLNIAIVIDEYGGLAGIVTLEDVIEEVLGEIYDEHEKKGDEKILYLENGEYLIKAEILLPQLNDALGIDLPHGKYAQTLGGYLMECLDHIPVKGEVIDLPQGRFVVDSVSRKKIISVNYKPGSKQLKN
ncbi:MAG: HlyC/CorC family transporter [Spirochaetes bacterium]|nr:MAG: HlyC/CorC family transporter [Spirochaetota bacterium]